MRELAKMAPIARPAYPNDSEQLVDQLVGCCVGSADIDRLAVVASHFRFSLVNALGSDVLPHVYRYPMVWGP